MYRAMRYFRNLQVLKFYLADVTFYYIVTYFLRDFFMYLVNLTNNLFLYRNGEVVNNFRMTIFK